MGLGDELLAAGHARRVSRETGKRVAILDREGRVRFHELWQGLDFITPCREEGVATITNGPGARPYIQYPFTTETGQRFTGWRARDHRPVVSETLVGQRSPRGVVLIEPTVKRVANPNKLWPYWQQVVDALPDVDFVQCGPDAGHVNMLRGARVVYAVTETFIAAMRVLNKALLYVGAEGGMHHAAAALGVPAVVVFGGALSVEATGYPEHANFGGTDPCGRWVPCGHCAQVLKSITPDAVVAAIKEKLQ